MMLLVAFQRLQSLQDACVVSGQRIDKVTSQGLSYTLLIVFTMHSTYRQVDFIASSPGTLQ